MLLTPPDSAPRSNTPWLQLGLFKHFDILMILGSSIVGPDRLTPMPVKVVKRGNKYRIVEISNDRIVRRRGGTAVDGGGKATRADAERIARAINANESK